MIVRYFSLKIVYSNTELFQDLFVGQFFLYLKNLKLMRNKSKSSLTKDDQYRVSKCDNYGFLLSRFFIFTQISSDRSIHKLSNHFDFTK